MKQIHFVKCHAGYDEIIFIPGNQVPDEKVLEISLSLLEKPSIGGTEVGVLYPPEKGGDVKVKIVDGTSEGFIRMCGGLTQCLGKTIIETNLKKKVGLNIPKKAASFLLETDAGTVPINLENEKGRVQKVTTNMKSYVEDCYERAVEKISLSNLTVVNVGVTETEREFLVIDMEELNEVYPEINFWRKQQETLNILENIYREFMNLKGYSLDVLYGALYQLKKDTERKKVAESVFRFFPWDRCLACSPDFACGTGTTAIGIAMNQLNQLDEEKGAEAIHFKVGDVGDASVTPASTDLYIMKGAQGKIEEASFSIRPIELIAYGKVFFDL